MLTIFREVCAIEFESIARHSTSKDLLSIAGNYGASLTIALAIKPTDGSWMRSLCEPGIFVTRRSPVVSLFHTGNGSQ
jgi:hypothetical protein